MIETVLVIKILTLKPNISATGLNEMRKVGRQGEAIQRPIVLTAMVRTFWMAIPQ